MAKRDKLTALRSTPNLINPLRMQMERFSFFKRSVLAVVVCLACIANLNAQSPIAADKRAAIQELLNLIGVTQAAKATFVTLIDQYSQALAKNSVDSFEKQNWPPETKEKATLLAQDFYKRVSARLREEVPQRIQYEEKVGRLYLDVYDQHFTESEIRELIAFYRSPAGQKFLEITPRVATVLQQTATAEFEAQTMSVTREIVAEELKKLEGRAAVELKPSPR